MDRLLYITLWIVLNVLPDSWSMFLLDKLVPGWDQAARKAYEKSQGL